MVNRARAAMALAGLSSLLSSGGQSAAAYTTVRARFVASLSAAAQAFLDGGNRQSTINVAKRAVNDQYGAASKAATGSDVLAGDDLTFFNAEVADEFGNLQTLWSDLKLQAADGNTALPADRVEAYARSLDGLFNELKGRGQKKTMVSWQIGPTETHCRGRGSCSWLDGQEHTVQWFIDRNYIPRKPFAAMQCGGHHCECQWIGPDGQPFNYDGA